MDFLFFLAVALMLLHFILKWLRKKLPLKPYPRTTPEWEPGQYERDFKPNYSGKDMQQRFFQGFLAGFGTALLVLWLISSPAKDEYGFEYEPWMPTNKAIFMLLLLIAIGYFGINVLGNILGLLNQLRLRSRKG